MKALWERTLRCAIRAALALRSTWRLASKIDVEHRDPNIRAGVDGSTPVNRGLFGMLVSNRR